MRLRGLSIGVLGIVLVAGAALVAWPSLAPRLTGLIEARLARETGLVWRIGGLGLDPAPGLDLRDVTFDGDGVSGRLARVRATGPWALLWGGSGTVEARIEGARLGLPLALGIRAPRDGPGDAGERRGVAALRAVLRGVAASAGSGTLSLSADAADLALDLADDAAGRDPGVRVELPDRGAVAEIDPAPPGAARTVRLTLAADGLPRIAATASARRDASDLRLDGIAGTIDSAPFSGSLAVVAPGPSIQGPSDKPRLTLDLRLDALALVDANAALRADPVAGITVPVRTDRVPDPAWFSGFEGQATVAVQRLALGPLRATAVALTAGVKAGRLDAALAAATLYQGGARGRYVLDPDGRHQIGLSLSGARVLPLMRDVAGVGSLDGTGSLRLDIQAEGATTGALLRSAAGQAEVAILDGRIDGLDLARAAGMTGLGGGLSTRLDRLGGRFSLGDGRARTGDLQLVTGLIAAEGTGSLDLIARTIDLQFKPLKVTAGAGGRLDVPIRIAGPWDGPSVSADFSGLAQDPAGALQGLQSLGSSILGGGDGRPGRGGADLGDGLGGLLDGLMPRRDPARGRRP